MSKYNSDEYNSSLSIGELAEKELEKILIENGFKPIKNISYDTSGRITWQQINLYGRNLRNLDFDVFSKNGNKFIFKAECKQLSSLYSNMKYMKNTPKFKRIYLTIEKNKFDDYVMVNQLSEDDCYVFFLVGVINQDGFVNGYDLYWHSVEIVKNSIVDVGFPYGEFDPDGNRNEECYIIDFNNMLRLDDISWVL